jgi:hypothetical protein
MLTQLWIMSVQHPSVEVRALAYKAGGALIESLRRNMLFLRQHHRGMATQSRKTREAADQQFDVTEDLLGNLVKAMRPQ